MALTTLEIVLVPFIPATFILLFFVIHIKKKQMELELALQKSQMGKENSIELTAFLADVKKYGFGFVRVDPGSVFMRTTRE
jgi:hypothetical protein